MLKKPKSGRTAYYLKIESICTEKSTALHGTTQSSDALLKDMQTAVTSTVNGSSCDGKQNAAL